MARHEDIDVGHMRGADRLPGCALPRGSSAVCRHDACRLPPAAGRSGLTPVDRREAVSGGLLPALLPNTQV